MLHSRDFQELRPYLCLDGPATGPSGGSAKPERYRGPYLKKTVDGSSFESSDGAIQYAENLKNYYTGQRNEVLGDTAISLLPQESDLSFKQGVDSVTLRYEAGVLNKGLIKTLVENSPMLSAAYGQNRELGDLLYASVMSTGREAGFDVNFIPDNTKVELGKFDGREGMVRVSTPDGKQYIFALYADWLRGAQSALNAPAPHAPATPPVVPSVAPPVTPPVEPVVPMGAPQVVLESPSSVASEAPVILEEVIEETTVPEGSTEGASSAVEPEKTEDPLAALQALGQARREREASESAVKATVAPAEPEVSAPQEEAPVEDEKKPFGFFRRQEGDGVGEVEEAPALEPASAPEVQMDAETPAESTGDAFEAIGALGKKVTQEREEVATQASTTPDSMPEATEAEVPAATVGETVPAEDAPAVPETPTAESNKEEEVPVEKNKGFFQRLFGG